MSFYLDGDARETQGVYTGLGQRCPKSNEGIRTYIPLHPKVLVVGVYKLAAREGSSPRSRLGECGCECESVVV